MRRIHRTALSKSNPLADRLKELMVPTAETQTIAVFEVDEADGLWPQVRDLLRSEDRLDSVRTEFTLDEVRAAEWLELGSSWHWSYPMPDDDAITYLEQVYDLSAWCRRCWVGAVQVKPFRLRSEPKWGTRRFLQLNWVFDEFFVRPEVWQMIQAAGLQGIDVLAPLHHKTGNPLGTVLQLRINHLVEEALAAEGRKFTTCGNGPVPPALAQLPACGRRVYDPSDLGPLKLHRDVLPNGVDMVKTAEWFGGVAHRRVLISRRFGKLILDRKWRGVNLRPVESV